jgi:hypothetical protein
MEWIDIPQDTCQLGVPLGHSAQTMHLSWIKISTISKRTELSLEPHHWGVPSGASKTISMHMVRSTQTVHQSCVKISTTSKRTELSLDPRHLGVPSGASKMISKPMVQSTQTMHLSCFKIRTISERTETSLHLSLGTYWYHQMCPRWFMSLWYV